MEHFVEQKSPEWLELRKRVALTSSRFGDALGLGKGKSYDFLMSLVSDDDVYITDDANKYIDHGISMEHTIEEMYQVLTGSQTRSTGFWTVRDTPSNSTFKGLFGASPDCLVLGKNYNPSCSIFDGVNLIGLVEMKAPVYEMYSGTDLLQGIPRHYMAQIQGQMFITGSSWCDFLAVCCKTKEILLKRVFYSEEYWQRISVVLKQFCLLLKEAQVRKNSKDPNMANSPLDFQSAKNLKFVPQRKSLFTGEDKIKIVDLLRKGRTAGMICGPSNLECNFDMLIGEEYYLPENLQKYGVNLLNEVDENTKRKDISVV